MLWARSQKRRELQKNLWMLSTVSMLCYGSLPFVPLNQSCKAETPQLTHESVHKSVSLHLKLTENLLVLSETTFDFDYPVRVPLWVNLKHALSVVHNCKTDVSRQPVKKAKKCTVVSKILIRVFCFVLEICISLDSGKDIQSITLDMLDFTEMTFSHFLHITFPSLQFWSTSLHDSAALRGCKANAQASLYKTDHSDLMYTHFPFSGDRHKPAASSPLKLL